MSITGSHLLGGDHQVLFYDHDHELVSAIVASFVPTIEAGGKAIVVATRDHAPVIERGLHAALDEPDPAGSVVLLDAAQLLDSFLVGGHPQPALFDATVGRLVRDHAADGAKLSVFGEMVALLWSSGDVDAALELEALWNDLGRSVPFSLLCGYPIACLDQRQGAEPFLDICGTHSAVHGPGNATDLAATGQFIAQMVEDLRHGILRRGEALLVDARRTLDELVELEAELRLGPSELA